MSKTNNYLWNETERHMDLVEKAACETLLQSEFTDVNTKEKVIDKLSSVSAKVLVGTNKKGWIMLSLIADDFDTHDQDRLFNTVKGYIKNILEGTHGDRQIQTK